MCSSDLNNEDINALRNQNPILLINNTFCQAIYHFDSNSLTDYDTKMPITPYGQWSVQNNKLLGKKCMIIPQTLPSTSIIATLTVGYRTFECSLTEDFVLEAGKSSELILWYDPANASNQITANISDWIEGDSSEVNAEETDEKDYVSANELNFSGSHVLTVYSKGVAIARICKELLFNTQINEEGTLTPPFGALDEFSVLRVNILGDDGSVLATTSRLITPYITVSAEKSLAAAIAEVDINIAQPVNLMVAGVLADADYSYIKDKDNNTLWNNLENLCLKDVVNVPVEAMFIGTSNNTLKSLILPVATAIGEKAFCNYINLTAVSLPNATTIGNG